MSSSLGVLPGSQMSVVALCELILQRGRRLARHDAQATNGSTQAETRSKGGCQYRKGQSQWGSIQ